MDNFKKMSCLLLSLGMTTTLIPTLDVVKAKNQTGLIDHKMAQITGSSSYEGYGVEKAFDGLCDDENRWASHVSGIAELNFNFNEKVTFNRIKITEMYKEFGNRLTSLEVQTSEDGTHYTTKQAFDGLKDNGPKRDAFNGNKSESTVEDLKLNESITSKYVKLIFHSGDKEVNINEVQFFNEVRNVSTPLKEKIKEAMKVDLRTCKTQDIKEFNQEVENARNILNNESSTEQQQTQAVLKLNTAIGKIKASKLENNLALNKSAIAENVYSENGHVFNEYNGSKTVDGKFDTRWATRGENGPFDIIIDLENKSKFNQVILYETDEFKGRLGNVKVEVSNDKKTWSTWYKMDKVDASILSMVDKPAEARYIKITMQAKEGNTKGLNTDEIGIYFDEQAINLHYNRNNTVQKRPIDPNWIKPTPSKTANINQLRKQEMKYGMFIHYGVNTFTDNYWGFGNEDPTIFNPDASTYNPEEWVKTAWESGMNYIVLITKHHDGFSLFDTKYSDYKVTNNGHADTNFDVVKATADACKKYGIKLGLYYSIWDQHWDNTHPLENYIDQTERDQAYADFAYNQIEELMTNYGEVCELWIDGGWEKETSRWEYEHIYDMVKRTNPNCQMSVNLTIGNKEIGQLQGGEEIVNFPSDFKLYDGQDTNPNGDPKVFKYQGEDYYLPFEGTFIIGNEWFWNTKSEQGNMREKDPQKIVDWYNKYVKQENTLVVNVPPSNKGVQTPHEIAFINEAARRLGIARGDARANIPNDECAVEIRHVTTDGSIAATTEYVYGKEGESYKTSPNSKLKDLGYTLVTTPTNASGKFGKDKVTVEYVYNDDLLHKMESADYTELNNALQLAAKEKEELRTPESWKVLVDAVKAGKDLPKDLPVAEQEKVTNAAAAITTAISKLQYKKADYSKVDEVIQKAEALNKEDYKDFSKVEAAIQAVVRNQDITKQSEVDAMAKAIEKAIAELDKKEVVNKDELKEAIAKKPAKEEKAYTSESWKTYQEALEHAKEVNANKNATQEEVNKAKETLLNAMQYLKENPDLTPLKPSISKDTTEKPNTIDQKENEEKPNTGVSTNTALLWSMMLGVMAIVIQMVKNRKLN